LRTYSFARQHVTPTFMTPPPDPTPVCIPYAQATPHQLALALAYATTARPAPFPTPGFAAWATALRQLKPDLWRAREVVSLDEQDLQDLRQRLASSEELPELDPPSYPDRTGYLVKRFVNYQDEALEALPDIAANPLAYSRRVFNLVVTLALGNSVVDELSHATHRGPQGRPGSVDPARARPTVHEQVRALRRARGEVGYLAMPERPAGPAERAAPGK
jgi:uncharacterized membrane protein YccC